MEFELTSLTLKDIYEFILNDKIDLNPPYQRNFIWTAINQKQLIDTILKNYPLPNFFIYRKKDGSFEMVDGQQRSKTIFKFIQGEITSSQDTGKKSFKEVDKENFFNYWIPVVMINKVDNEDSLRDFYVLINKRGVHLNTSEIYKSEYFESNFLKLAENLLEYQPFISLDLFTEATIKRMNDRAYIEELIGYLYTGIKEKKISVKNTYDEDISDEDSVELSSQFKQIIDKICIINDSVQPISTTRYKQKNDFYTLFNFINENIAEEIEILVHQYKILLILDGKDSNGRQFIRPSNEDCESLKMYANNCVTQSNSKNARVGRLEFFNRVLKNTSPDGNEILNDVIEYLEEELNTDIRLNRFNNYYLMSID